MNQKGFANIILVIVIVILVGAVGYFALVKKSPEVTQQTNTLTPTNNQQNSQPSPTQTQTPKYPIHTPKSPTPTPTPQNKNVFVNSPYGLDFTLPNGYLVGSNHYGVTDASKAEAFYFRKESNNYSNVPVLDVSTNLEPSSGQTLNQFAQSIYSLNKDKNQVTTDLKQTNYGGTVAYEFGLQTAISYPVGGQLLDLSGAKVVFLQHGGKTFKFLLTGADSGLTNILNSLKFK
ncbi:MAG: hypothetical protein HYT43_01430 [Candidatus Taylorbacteria bacterium]|nr:hypothetical protein [Candidatus Taylorbacteria bacterium]